MLSDIIKQIPDENATLELLGLFEKLLKKYARLLSYEDAYEDLQLFLLELLHAMKEKEIGAKSDGYIVKYIAVSVKNKYIVLSKHLKEFKEVSYADISDEQMIYVEQLAAKEDKNDISIYFPGSGKLSAREKQILELFFVKEYSIEEISNHLRISRQAVNQAKNRALNKIRSTYFQ